MPSGLTGMACVACGISFPESMGTVSLTGGTGAGNAVTTTLGFDGSFKLVAGAARGGTTGADGASANAAGVTVAGATPGSMAGKLCAVSVSPAAFEDKACERGAFAPLHDTGSLADGS
jgi:hypothetical protein